MAAKPLVPPPNGTEDDQVFASDAPLHGTHRWGKCTFRGRTRGLSRRCRMCSLHTM
jgi:hypothetical protein